MTESAKRQWQVRRGALRFTARAWAHEQDICPDTLYEDAKKLTSK
jgi:hypothetical protein